MVLLRVELLMLMFYFYFSLKLQQIGWMIDSIFFFICIVVLEGVIGLCILIKNYRFMGDNIFLRW